MSLARDRRDQQPPLFAHYCRHPKQSPAISSSSSSSLLLSTSFPSLAAPIPSRPQHRVGVSPCTRPSVQFSNLPRRRILAAHRRPHLIRRLPAARRRPVSACAQLPTRGRAQSLSVHTAYTPAALALALLPHPSPLTWLLPPPHRSTARSASSSLPSPATSTPPRTRTILTTLIPTTTITEVARDSAPFPRPNPHTRPLRLLCPTTYSPACSASACASANQSQRATRRPRPCPLSRSHQQRPRHRCANHTLHSATSTPRSKFHTTF